MPSAEKRRVEGAYIAECGVADLDTINNQKMQVKKGESFCP